MRQIVNVERLPDVDETRIDFDEPLGFRWLVVEPVADLYVFRGRGALFGATAPDWRMIPDALKLAFLESSSTDPPTETEWPNQEANTKRFVHLDREYPKIVPESWMVLMTGEYREAYRVKVVTQEGRADYTLTGRVTRIKTDTDENFAEYGLDPTETDAVSFPKVRNTVALFESEKMELAKRITPIPVENDQIKIVEDASDMESGRQIMVIGPVLPGGTVAGEVATVVEVIDGGHTLLLEQPLENSYLRSETAIYANVVEATHGETVAGEVLGSGDASIPFQRFQLKQKPLTYVSQAGAPGGAAPELEVRVNGIRWQGVPSFYGREGDEAIYTIDVTDEQETIIRLGDGTTGALPSSGQNNVTASYRKGIGRDGNLPAGVIKTALERPKGLKNVVNPLASAGGADPESLELIRSNAPNTVRTFGRIVSLRDFEDAAREFIGVAKARAFIDWDDEWQVVKLIVAGDEGAAIVEPQRSTLLDDLNSRRDPNRKMTLFTYCPVDVQLSLTFYPHEDYVAETVADDVRAAIEAFFDFDRLRLGQSLALSELYAAIHEVAGVVGVEITRFLPVPPPACDAAPASRRAKSTEPLQAVIRIEPYELARLDTNNLSNFEIEIGASDR